MNGQCTADQPSQAPKSLLWGGLPSNIRLIVIASVIGVTVGAAAFVLKEAIAWVSRGVTVMFDSSTSNAFLLVVPVVGIVLAGVYQRYIIRTGLTHGVERLSRDIATGNSHLGPKLTYGPIIASTLTLGFGGSAGSEGPIAYAGAAIGSNIGRVFGVDRTTLMLLVGCGAGAGIAGIFKAPIGGVLFTLEVLGMAMSTPAVIALVAAAVCASTTAYVFSGFTMDLPWTHAPQFVGEMIPWSLLLGVFCALYSVYYSRVMRRMRRVYERIKNPWLENIAGGIVLAVTVFLFPTLYGEGYQAMGRIINADFQALFDGSVFYGVHIGRWTLPLLLAGILAVKCFATSASNSAGGVAGDFAPTLFAGCIAGLFFATTLNAAFDLGLDAAAFAYIGMAGVMAGAIRAPLMAFFLTSEMSNGYGYFLPLLIVSVVSYCLTVVFSHEKFFTRHYPVDK